MIYPLKRGYRGSIGIYRVNRFRVLGRTGFTVM